jgi:outer membrane immunogenic protein
MKTGVPSARSSCNGLKLRLAIVAVCSLTSMSVLAADMPLKYQSPPLIPAFNWTGFYIGINGGYGWGRFNAVNEFGDNLSSDTRGGLVGGTAGFNYQWRGLVVGLEGDLDWSGMRQNQTSAISNDVFLGIPPTSAVSITYKNDILSTLAMRFGVTLDRTLIFAKGGGVWAHENFNFAGSGPALGTISGSNSFDRLGVVAGGGVEYAVTNKLTLKAEYDYIGLGVRNETLTLNTSLAGPTTAPISSKATMNVVKFGANWLFNGR